MSPGGRVIVKGLLSESAAISSSASLGTSQMVSPLNRTHLLSQRQMSSQKTPKRLCKIPILTPLIVSASTSARKALRPWSSPISTTSLGSKTFTGGTFDAADTSVTVAGATEPVAALVGYLHTGTEGTSRLVWYMDSATGLPLTISDGTVNVTWDAAGIFSL